MSYYEVSKYVQNTWISTNNADIADMVRIAHRKGALNAYDKKELLQHLQSLQNVLERLDPTYKG